MSLPNNRSQEIAVQSSRRVRNDGHETEPSTPVSRQLQRDVNISEHLPACHSHEGNTSQAQQAVYGQIHSVLIIGVDCIGFRPPVDPNS